ncbi:MAG: hypothetical protein HKP58_03285 [Desulfatitalea sp.]|nr:hypothetical protein [Desulfatitalea sp.]NNJ99416.1 hypothetical protein [Desulfatitalea sp.]
MMKNNYFLSLAPWRLIGFCITFCVLIVGLANADDDKWRHTFAPIEFAVDDDGNGWRRKSFNWWDVEPEAENPSAYYDSVLYSEIAPRLHEITQTSNRVNVKVIGKSAGGRDLYLAIVAAPGDEGRFGHYRKLRWLMIKDPEKAQQLIAQYDDFKVPVFINASIHGDEYPGTDAAMRLIETLAYEHSEAVQTVLDHMILLVNVCQNPDGRVMGTRGNGKGFDINRDFLTQSQPESRATAGVIAKWNPMISLDLHGFINPMLIEPCTPPHNPNYEYDLYLTWAYEQALAMRDELFSQTDETEVIIPYLSSGFGWDDWPPIYAAMYPMLHGSYGHTLETPHRDKRGVDAHYAAVWGALKFIVQHKKEMINDQIEVYRRGFLNLPQVRIPEYLLDETQFEQFNALTIQKFPAAYLIAADAPLQLSAHQAANLIDFLLFNGVQVDKTAKAIWHDGDRYPKGTYVVWMDQPKRAMANAILEDGMDLSNIEGLAFYSPPSAWSHPLLWGVNRTVVKEDIDIRTRPVFKAKKPMGTMALGSGDYFAYLPTTIAAFKATNDLMAQGVTVYRASEKFEDKGRTFGVGTFLIHPKKWKPTWKLIKQYALDVFPVTKLPAKAILVTHQRIAVYGDEGVRHCLDELGFDYDEVTSDALNDGVIPGYDVFINRDLRWTSLDDNGRASFAAWFAAGGDYVGLGYRGSAIDFANDAGITDVDYGEISGDGIVKVDYMPQYSVAAGFRAQGYAFVYRSVWFTKWPEAAKKSAYIQNGPFLVAGFWPDWQNSGADGMPVVLHTENSDSSVQDTVLIGIDPTFCGHPRNTFRIVGNAIFSGLD